MAQPTTSKFSEFVIFVGDGATPTEAFTKLCGLTSKGLSITNNTATTAVPDCDDEDLPAFEEEAIVSQSFPVTGTGVFTQEDQKTLLDWALNGEVKNIRVQPGEGTTGDVDYYQGPAILANLGLSVERGQKLSAQMEFRFTAKPTATLIS